MTEQLYQWFYQGLGGLGGWFLFAILALISVWVLFFDARRRGISSKLWKIFIILACLLFLPFMIYRLAGGDSRPALQSLRPLLLFLGLLSGGGSLILLGGYLLSYWGYRPAPKFRLPEETRSVSESPVVQSETKSESDRVILPPSPVYEEKVPAWLVSPMGIRYPLNIGETTIGCSPTSDIRIQQDETVASQHAKILYANGVYQLIEIDAAAITRVNGKLVAGSKVLNPNDEISFGEKTLMNFIVTQR